MLINICVYIFVYKMDKLWRTQDLLKVPSINISDAQYFYYKLYFFSF